MKEDVAEIVYEASYQMSGLQRTSTNLTSYKVLLNGTISLPKMFLE